MINNYYIKDNDEIIKEKLNIESPNQLQQKKNILLTILDF